MRSYSTRPYHFVTVGGDVIKKKKITRPVTLLYLPKPYLKVKENNISVLLSRSRTKNGELLVWCRRYL